MPAAFAVLLLISHPAQMSRPGWFEVHAHLRVSVRFRSHGLSVGRWLAQQRDAYRNGTLDARIASAIDAIDPMWSNSLDQGLPAAVAAVKERQARLLLAAQAFHQAKGHLQVPHDFVHDGLHLGGFVYRCRRNAAVGKLSPDLAEALTSIDPHWTMLLDVPLRYQPMLYAATAFRAIHGHLRVPKAYVTPDGKGLGWWLADRRTQKRARTLHPGLGTALDAIDPAWADLQNAARNRRSASDAAGIAALREFAAENGHARVAVHHQTAAGFKLWAWLARRREEHRRGTLEKELYSELSDLGVAWEPEPKAPKIPPPRIPKPDPATEYLDAMIGFLEAEGHVQVPSEHVTEDGVRLGRWLGRQRAAYRKGTLRPSVEAELRALQVNLSRRRNN